MAAIKTERLPEIQDIVDKLQNGPVEINGFQLTQFVGHGEFADVFKGYADKFKRIPVAIKLPRNPEAIKDIKSRQAVLSALGKSQYSVNMHPTGSDNHNGIPLVAESYHEKTLSDKMMEYQSQGIHPSLEEVVNVGKALLTGIDHFHRLKETDPKAAEQLGIDSLIHNDIKPSNIMYDEIGGVAHYLFTDFGVRLEEIPGAKPSMRNSISAASIQNRDKAGKIVGKIYAAPEVRDALIRQQATGEEIPSNPVSDLWSIGAILYDYATGKIPQWGYRNINESRNDLPLELNEFFRKILEGDPAKRFQSARQALGALEGVLTLEDAYLIGISRTSSTDYILHRIPIKNGKKASDGISHKFKMRNNEVPYFRYVPDFDSVVLVRSNIDTSIDGNEPDKYPWAFDLLDMHHNVLKKNFSFTPGAIIKILKNKSDGRTALIYDWKKVGMGIRVKSLPELEDMGKDKSEFTGMFKPWREYEAQNSKNYWLKNNEGCVLISRNGSYYNQIPIEGHVISAKIVDRKK